MSPVETSLFRDASHWLRTSVLCGFCSLATFTSQAEKARLSKCPPSVQETIKRNLLGGKLDEIKAIRINDHVLYLVEIDFKGFREAKLYISGDGTLQKILEEIRLRDLPEQVRLSVEQQVNRRAQIEDIEKEIIDGRVRYRVEIDPPKQRDRIVVFEENGTISSDK